MSDGPKGVNRAADQLAGRLYTGFNRIEGSGVFGNAIATSMRIKWDESPGREILIVFKGVKDDIPVIAFHGGWGLVETIAQAFERERTDSLKWRVDEWEMKNNGYSKEAREEAGRYLDSLS